jgi:hypothetical protein
LVVSPHVSFDPPFSFLVPIFGRKKKNGAILTKRFSPTMSRLEYLFIVWQKNQQLHDSSPRSFLGEQSIAVLSAVESMDISEISISAVFVFAN